jgi:hypothetical protein
VFPRLTVRFGASLVAVAAASALVLALAGGGSPLNAVYIAAAGGALVVVGVLAREPGRMSTLWLAAILLAAGVLMMSLHGIAAITDLIGSGRATDWWPLAQAVVFAATLAYIVLIARVSLLDGKRRAEALASQTGPTPQGSRASRAGRSQGPTRRNDRSRRR